MAEFKSRMSKVCKLKLLPSCNQWLVGEKCIGTPQLRLVSWDFSEANPLRANIFLVSDSLSDDGRSELE